MNKKSKVIVAGGTGLVGSALLNLLLDDENIEEVISVVRKQTNKNHPGLKELIVDFDQLENYKNELTGDAIFCCLGTTIKKAKTKENFKKVDYRYPLELAKVAFENEVPNYHIITAMGSDSNSSIFYNRVKGEVEEAISQYDFESLNIYRPSLLMGDREESRPGENFGIILAKVLNPLMLGPLRKYRGIDINDVARTIYLTFKNPKKGKHIFLSDEIYDIARK